MIFLEGLVMGLEMAIFCRRRFDKRIEKIEKKIALQLPIWRSESFDSSFFFCTHSISFAPAVKKASAASPSSTAAASSSPSYSSAFPGIPFPPGVRAVITADTFAHPAAHQKILEQEKIFEGEIAIRLLW